MYEVYNCEDLDENLCDYCPVTDYGIEPNAKFCITPNGYSSCEGCCCEEAYGNYLDDANNELGISTKSIEYSFKVKLLNEEDFL